MKNHSIALSILLFTFAVRAMAQDMDAELTRLTESLAEQIKARDSKKITVLDFTDLDGTSIEIGKYLAEQMTVNFVMKKRAFSVLDRTNLKRILAEHKLTSTGLINPENAKKLGMFSGVDAMIFGKAVPLGDKLSVTVQIISTESAEVYGGGKAIFPQDDSIHLLLAKPSTQKETADEDKVESLPPERKPFGDLQAKIESFQYVPSSTYASTVLNFIITNTSASKTYGVAYLGNPYTDVNFNNNRGEAFKGTEVIGIDAGGLNQGTTWGTFTDIPPRTAITIISKNQIIWKGAARPGDYRPYRFQTMIFFGEENLGRYSNVRKHNLILDIK
jgi:TolB-like protein